MFECATWPIVGRTDRSKTWSWAGLERGNWGHNIGVSGRTLGDRRRERALLAPASASRALRPRWTWPGWICDAALYCYSTLLCVYTYELVHIASLRNIENMLVHLFCCSYLANTFLGALGRITISFTFILQSLPFPVTRLIHVPATVTLKLFARIINMSKINWFLENRSLIWLIKSNDWKPQIPLRL